MKCRSERGEEFPHPALDDQTHTFHVNERLEILPDLFHQATMTASIAASSAQPAYLPVSTFNVILNSLRVSNELMFFTPLFLPFASAHTW